MPMSFAHMAADQTGIRVALSRKTTIRQLVLRADGDRPRRGEYARRASIEVGHDELSDVDVVGWCCCCLCLCNSCFCREDSVTRGVNSEQGVLNMAKMHLKTKSKMTRKTGTKRP